MGTYSNQLTSEVRLERMTPEQIEAAKARRSAMYVPCGSIEWHGYHNVVGLDALKAHEQLVGLAQQQGGVVYPPLYLGSGGGHTDWPSSFMVSSKPMIQLISELLHAFERDGYRQAVLLSGHYPNHPEYQQRSVDRYKMTGGKMRVISLIEVQAPGVEGDHAAKQETSYMLHLHPNLVHMERLLDGPQNDIGGPDERINYMGDEYRGHPCYGLVGIDPRTHASAAVGRANTERLLAFLAAWLNE